MSLNLGSTSIDSLYLGSTKIGEAYLGSTKVYSSVDPYNPLGLPPFTIRAKFSSGYTPNTGDSTTLVDATENIWDITRETSWLGLFGQDTSNLVEVLGANATGVTSTSNMFFGCSSLTSVPLFDTSSVTNTEYMFAACRNLTSVPLFDTSSSTNMWGMFGSCASLTSVPLFDTSSSTKMNYMFSDCTSLTSVPLFDTSSATSMDYMFNNCPAVESGALALYQAASALPNVPTHTNTFYNCGNNTQTGAAELAQIPQSWGGTMDPCNPLNLPAKTIRAKFSSGYTPAMGSSQTLVDATDNVWDITQNITDWSYLFYSTTNLLKVLGANTTGVTTMECMFQYCSYLTSVPLFDTSSVRNMSYMFHYCASLTSVPLFDTSSATLMPNMFCFCYGLTSLPLFDSSSAKNVTSMFYGCTAVESGALALYQQMSTQATPPTTYTTCFTNCGSGTVTGAAELAQIPSSWGGTGA